MVNNHLAPRAKPEDKGVVIVNHKSQTNMHHVLNQLFAL